MTDPAEATRETAAPVPNGVGVGEILHVFGNQIEAGQDILAETASAVSVDILALRGSELIALVEPLTRAALAATPDGPVVVRVLLLEADSQAARERASQLGEAPESFAEEIRLTRHQMSQLASSLPSLHLNLFCYRELPVWRMVVVDGIQYVSVLCPMDPEQPSAIYKIQKVVGGALYQGFQDTFAIVLAGARQILSSK